eukprot:3790998-Pyramimonas_sp.AAC.1
MFSLPRLCLEGFSLAWLGGAGQCKPPRAVPPAPWGPSNSGSKGESKRAVPPVALHGCRAKAKAKAKAKVKAKAKAKARAKAKAMRSESKTNANV